MTQPSSLFNRLVRLDGSVKAIVRELSQRSSVADNRPPVILTKRDIGRALSLFLNHVLSAEELTIWADYLELNDAVEYQEGAEDMIAHALFVLSTPEINGPLTPELAHDLLGTLGYSALLTDGKTGEDKAAGEGSQ